MKSIRDLIFTIIAIALVMSLIVLLFVDCKKELEPVDYCSYELYECSPILGCTHSNLNTGEVSYTGFLGWYCDGN